MLCEVKNPATQLIYITFSCIETVLNEVHFDKPNPLTLFCEKAKFEYTKTKITIINFFIYGWKCNLFWRGWNDTR